MVSSFFAFEPIELFTFFLVEVFMLTHIFSDNPSPTRWVKDKWECSISLISKIVYNPFVVSIFCHLRVRRPSLFGSLSSPYSLVNIGINFFKTTLASSTTHTRFLIVNEAFRLVIAFP